MSILRGALYMGPGLFVWIDRNVNDFGISKNNSDIKKSCKSIQVPLYYKSKVPEFKVPS